MVVQEIHVSAYHRFNASRGDQTMSNFYAASAGIVRHHILDAIRSRSSSANYLVCHRSTRISPPSRRRLLHHTR